MFVAGYFLDKRKRRREAQNTTATGQNNNSSKSLERANTTEEAQRTENGQPGEVSGQAVLNQIEDEKKPNESDRMSKATPSPSHDFHASEIDIRPVAHKYLFRRPRALQYTYKDETMFLGDEIGVMPGGRAPTMFDDGYERTAYDIEGISKSREKLDLFIDLIWVGIVTNLSEVFAKIFYESDSGAGAAFALYLIPFLAAYRIWNMLRTFLDSFYMDDTFQRLFIYWMLLLAVFFGNNLVYLADNNDEDRFNAAKTVCITVYLVYRGSFIVMEAIYSYWIPWLRRLTFISWLLIMPSSGLWIASLFINGVNALGPIIVAIFWEFNVPLILEYPWAQRFIPSDFHKTFRPEILRSRMTSFFILSVGEGILLLLRGGPLGLGLNHATGLISWSLLIYLLLVFLYFNRDYSKRSVSAVNLKGWRFLGYMTLHVPLFSALIAMSSGIVHFITHNAPETQGDTTTAAATAAEGGHSSGGEAAASIDYTQRAIWSVAVCLAIVIGCMWVQAVLDKSLDRPGTLLVSNRYLRLILRPVYIIIILTIPVARLSDVLFLGIAALMLLIVSLYEMTASLESPARFMEPKGLTIIMRPLSETRKANGEGKVGV